MSGRELVDLLKVTLELGPMFEDKRFGFAYELDVDLLLLDSWPCGLFGKRPLAKLEKSWLVLSTLDLDF